MAKKAQTQTGGKAIRALFTDAANRAEDAAEIFDPDPHQARDGVLPGRWDGAPFDRMPADCPVKVVGRDAEGAVYCVSPTHMMVKMERWDMPALASLFAPMLNSMFFYWPGYSKTKKRKVVDADTGEETELPLIDRVERDKCMMAIMKEASMRPIFDPSTQHRGRGGWQDSQGNFIWHSGSHLWVSDGQGAKARLQRSRPAQHDGFLYTRQAATIEPWQAPVSQEESPAVRLLKYLASWNWQRPYLDPVLVLGWIATALMGGALKVRPIVFASGGAGVGKSRLQEVIRSALEGAVITSVNTTAAGIYQRIKLDSLPFMVDELESKANSTRPESIIELARVAYTGGDISRGGQDHEATTFTARNSFLFTAIIPPPMGAQDKSRMAMLNLGPIERPGRVEIDMVLKPETDGRMLLRQVMDGWRDFQSEILPSYARTLQEQGLSARAIDTYGTLLAAAELLVGKQALEDIGLPVAEDPKHFGAIIAEATAIERTETLAHWHQVIDIIYQSSIDAWKSGDKLTVGSVVEDFRTAQHLDLPNARDRLQLVNLGLMPAGWAGEGTGAVLGVPMAGPALKRIFADTEFHSGGWYTALKQAASFGVVLPARKIKINGSTKHCLLVDIEAFERFAARGD